MAYESYRNPHKKRSKLFNKINGNIYKIDKLNKDIINYQSVAFQNSITIIPVVWEEGWKYWGYDKSDTQFYSELKFSNLPESFIPYFIIQPIVYSEYSLEEVEWGINENDFFYLWCKETIENNITNNNEGYIMKLRLFWDGFIQEKDSRVDFGIRFFNQRIYHELQKQKI